MKLMNSMIKIKPSVTNDVSSFIKNYSEKTSHFRDRILRFKSVVPNETISTKPYCNDLPTIISPHSPNFYTNPSPHENRGYSPSRRKQTDSLVRISYKNAPAINKRSVAIASSNNIAYPGPFQESSPNSSVKKYMKCQVYRNSYDTNFA